MWKLLFIFPIPNVSQDYMIAKKHKKPHGLSLIELLIAISAIGILALIAVAVFSNATASAKTQKLKSDMAVLNSAVQAFRGSGGSFEGVEDPELVISKLKARTTAAKAKQIPGLSGSLLDPRTAVEWQTAEDAGKDLARIHWNGDKQRFELAFSGEAGIDSLQLDEAAVPEEPVVEEAERDTAFTYAATSDWIWDYESDAQRTFRTPTDIQLAPEPVTLEPESVTPPEEEYLPEPKVPADHLSPPVLSHPGGDYSIRDYDLPLVLTDPNPAGAAALFYSVDYGPWVRYDTAPTISLAPDSTLQTMAVAYDHTQWHNSSLLSSEFGAIPVDLQEPLIVTSAPEFGTHENYDVFVTITDPNVLDPSQLEFRINGGTWEPYPGDFSVSRYDYPTGLTVEARAVSEEPYYNDSLASFAPIGAEPFEINTDTLGEFHSAAGGPNMVAEVTTDPESTHFSWGSVYFNGSPTPGLSQSWLDFAGTTSSAVIGERVHLGSLNYYNGSTYVGTAAENVDLNLGVNLDIAGTSVDLSFDYGFNLINVINDEYSNSSDPTLAAASADYVRIDSSSQLTSFSINGFQYQLQLEFGSSSDNGFASFDEFHVFENRDAITEVFGTIWSIATGGISLTDPTDDDD